MTFLKRKKDVKFSMILGPTSACLIYISKLDLKTKKNFSCPFKRHLKVVLCYLGVSYITKELIRWRKT